jgi:hypothetical protein
MNGSDVASNDANKWVVVYIGGAGGTTAGQLYNTQQPALPFSALYHLRWKANDTYKNAEVWNGASWVDAGFSFTSSRNGSFVEMAIPRVSVGSPAIANVVVGMLNETPNFEGTYAGVPATTYSDSYDPNFAHYFAFDLGGCDVPGMYSPL